MTRHVVDSLSVLPPLERAYASRGGDIAGISLIDVGSGAGLPGLILAVARPSKPTTSLSRVGIGDDTEKSMCFSVTFIVEIWIGFVCFRLEIYTVGVDAEAVHLLGACR